MLDFLRKLFNSIFGNNNPETSSPENQSPETNQEPSKNGPEIEEKPEKVDTPVKEPEAETETTTEPDEEPEVETQPDVKPPDPETSVEVPDSKPETTSEPSVSIINPEVEADLAITEDPDKLMISIKRFDSGSEDTLGKLYLGGKFTCYTIEQPNSGNMISAGQYELGLDTTNGRHATYRFRFKGIHRGMLELQNVPNFSNILIHIGNRAEDTNGSILVGEQITQVDHENAREVWYSDKAYLRVYEAAVKQMDAGKKVVIDISEA